MTELTPISPISSSPPITQSADDTDTSWRLHKPIHSERHVRVICIGAGASGLLLAYKMQKHFSNYSLTVYEKNAEVSGTWYENRYPGCACDVPSHAYTFSFDPYPNWPSVFASSKEIFKYFNSFADKYALRHYIKTRHQIIGAYWNHKRNGYDVKIKDLDTNQTVDDFCDILINAGGVLNNWRWPDIPGLDTYKGTLVHSANWDDNIQLDGKHVGLIGNGSSGLQILPTIQPKVRKVTTFIRSPTWMTTVPGLEQRVYSEQEVSDFSKKPGELLNYRKQIERGLNGRFGLFLKGNKINKETHKVASTKMREKLSSKPYLADKLIPNFHIGCRRITTGVGYVEALVKDNVDAVFGEISQITEKGCLSDNGQEYPVDVLICATGFDASFRPRFPIIGPDGKNLQDTWKTTPKSYFGIAAPDLPNYLIFLGPNCPIGNGPVLSAIENQSDYMMKLIDRYQTENIRTFTPRRDAVEDFAAFKDEYMKKTVWSDPCRVWYKDNPNGTITALWPGSTLHYIEAIREVRMEDWDVTYSGNRYNWMGNGYSQTEADDTADLAYYVRERDDGEPLSRGKRRRLINKNGKVVQEETFNFAGRIERDEEEPPIRAKKRKMLNGSSKVVGEETFNYTEDIEELS